MPRIITGSAKNKKLKVAVATRPLSDRVKTSIFDTIQELVPNSSVLDIFAGSGSFGLEALSRGAVHAVFVEKDREAIDLLAQNINSCRFTDTSEIINQDVISFLTRNTKSFDIIFIDAPYPLPNKVKQAAAHRAANCLNPEGILIIKHEPNEAYPDKFDNLESGRELELVYEKKYNNNVISYYR